MLSSWSSFHDCAAREPLGRETSDFLKMKGVVIYQFSNGPLMPPLNFSLEREITRCEMNVSMDVGAQQ